MNKSTISSLLLIILAVIYSCNLNSKSEKSFASKIHTFYYNWYGNPEFDGEYFHWNHSVLPHWSDTTWNHAGQFPGGDNVGANFYPALGCYSSNDPQIISKHFELMNRAGIGVCVISWWGKDSYEDKSIPQYLEAADKYNLKIAFHIEPFYKSVEEFKEQLTYLHTKYGKHTALFLKDEKPVYYIYDSYKLKNTEWAKILTKNNKTSIRNTPLDAIFIGLWVHKDEGNFFTSSGFDGFYTYFASDGFVYGSTPSNWQHLSNFAQQNDLIFIPCVGPGYEDTRIRPWNSSNTKKRAVGVYYEKMFKKAMETSSEFIAITSFNEWHEGTQIEPAIPKTITNYTYQNYGTQPMFYIKKTKELVDDYKNFLDSKNGVHR